MCIVSVNQQLHKMIAIGLKTKNSNCFQFVGVEIGRQKYIGQSTCIYIILSGSDSFNLYHQKRLNVEMSSFIYQTRLNLRPGLQVKWKPFYDSSQLDSSILHQIKLKSVCHILFWCMRPFNRESNVRLL